MTKLRVNFLTVVLFQKMSFDFQRHIRRALYDLLRISSTATTRCELFLTARCRRWIRARRSLTDPPPPYDELIFSKCVIMHHFG